MQDKQKLGTQPISKGKALSLYFSCYSKVRFANPKTAKKACKRTGMRYYECFNCEGFHLTKREKK